MHELRVQDLGDLADLGRGNQYSKLPFSIPYNKIQITVAFWG